MMTERIMMKKDKRNGQKIRYRLYVSAFIMAAGVFAVMTYLQREALSEFDKKEICVASLDARW